ncbi:GNAT family N-acetyltransferase [Dongia rigui]|uniref:GNAT family N-acetyltransferase n=1 Tax=Dongia rigui TaxID=940149 RepID=A0ABU5DWU2_9PROT|nr:GNAT family N-acetyltransferase [Dongia rigui]MDY0871784.1 GNAT family N-acetyltransferase [Dongia rigui]
MPELIFRRATRADLEAIVDMLVDDYIGAKREDGSRPLNARYVAAFAAIEADPNQFLAVVEEDGEIVGSLQLTFIPGIARLGMWRGQIEGVRIKTSRRGSGLGHKMFDWAIAQCRAKGCELVQLAMDKTRTDTLRFYESLGFKASHEGLKLDLSK